MLGAGAFCCKENDDGSTFLSGAAAFVLLVAVGVFHVSAQAPAPAAPKGGGGRKGSPPQVPATPSDLSEIAKLAALPTWTAAAGDGDYSIGPDYTPAPEATRKVGTLTAS
jgi:hypothetical protein